MIRTTPSRLAACVLTAGLVAVSCSDGQSAIDAGNDDPVVTAAEPETDEESDTTGGTDTADTADDSSTDDEPAVESDGEAAGESADTEAAPPTTVGALAGLPTCDTSLLDSADGPVDVTLWVGLAAPLVVTLDALAADYNASQDRVVVTVQNQTDYENTIDNYFNLGVAQRPEVLLAPEFVVQAFAESDTFVPAQACMESAGFETDEFLPRALNAYSYGGVQWGLPFNLSSPVLFYNKVAFEAAGLDPEVPPLTFDELRAMSQQIVDSGAASYGIALDVGRDSAAGAFEQWFGRSNVPYVDNGNGREARATEVLFNNDTGVGILQFLNDMHADGLSFNVGQNEGGVPAFLKIADPQSPAAMTASTSAAISQVLTALDDGLGGDLTGEDIGVGYMPGPSPVPGAQVGGAALWIPAEKGDLEAAAAWDFAEFLTQAQSQSTWAAETGYVPVRSDALELDPVQSLYDDDPRFRVSFDQLSAPITDPAQARPALGPQREVRQLVADVIAAVYDNPDADLEALLDAAAATANSLIRNYNELN